MADDVVGRLIFETDVDVKDAKKGLEGFQDSMEDTQKVAQETEEQVGKAEHGISLKGAAIATAVGAAVLKLGKEVAKATNEIQEGRATIVNATGATGEALQGLMDSAKNVYSESEQSFDEVSRAIGEVNTRLGLTGEALETTTGLFLDFADATGQDVQQSVIAVTQAMNRWNLEAEALPSVLDKLTYAGQASGVSVSQLTQNLTANAGTLQAMGYSMDEAIAMMMQFELQGIESSAVLMGMKKSFEDSAKAGTDARYDWEQLMSSIANATDSTEANSLAIDAFGNRIATDMVSALQSGKLNFDDFTDALQNANGTLEATDEASKTTADRIETLKHSITLMLSEVGEELAPMVEDLLPTVKMLLEAVFEAIEPLIPVIGDLAKKLIPPLVQIITSLVGVVVPIIENILPPLTSALTLVGNILTALFTILTPILEVVTKIVGIGMNLVSSMLTPLLNLLTPIFNLIADAINAVLTPLVKVLDTIVGWIDKLIGGIKRLASWFGDTLLSAFGITKGAVEDTTDSVAELTEQVDTATEKTERYSVEIKDFSEQIQGATFAIDAETEAQKKNNVEAQSGIELTSVGTSLKYKQADASKKTARQLAEEAEAQKELDKLEQERIKTTQALTDRLESQSEQIQNNTAQELLATGKIEEAYEIRAKLLDKQRQKEVKALRDRIAENKATADDLIKLEKYYSNEAQRLEKEKNKAIVDSQKKASEQQKAELEALRKKAEEDADSIEKVYRMMGTNIGKAFSDLILAVIDNTEDKIEKLQTAVASFASFTGNALYDLGRSLAEGEADWTNLGKTALKALASIVRALAEEMTARAVLAAFSLNFTGALALGAGAAAAFVGAGLIDGYANSLLIGKDFVPYDGFPATLHRGEMVLDKIDAEKVRRYGGMYGIEQMASAPLSVDTQRLSPLNINNQLSAVIEVDGTQLGVAVLKNIDNASSFVLR